MLSPCLVCGEPTAGTRCAEHTADRDRTRVRGDFRQRYGGAAWDRLSQRARRLQGFCTDCGTTEQLGCDHLPSAWERLAARKPVRLVDVDVVCAACNNRRGSSRPGSDRARRVGLTTGGIPPPRTTSVPSGGAEFASQLRRQP